MYHTDDRPLGAIAEDAYEVLLKTIDPDDGLPREDTHAQLLEAGFADGDAEHALDRLLNRGYLYSVEGQLFITEHQGHDSE